MPLVAEDEATKGAFWRSLGLEPITRIRRG
jgi:hypothetical protein